MKSLIDKFKDYALYAAIVALAALAGYNHYNLNVAKTSITSLKDSVVTITAERDTLRTANASLAKELKAATATKDIVNDTKNTEVKVDKAATEASKIVSKRLAEIESKYSNMVKNEQNTKLKATEISLERAKGIWLTYCLQEPEEKACK